MRALLFLAALIALSQTPLPTGGQQPAAKPSPSPAPWPSLAAHEALLKNGYITVPLKFDPASNMMFVTCHIKGPKRVNEQAYDFLVDTGAGTNTIDAVTAEQLGLPVGDEVVETHGYNGAGKSRRTFVRIARIDDVRLPHLPWWVHDLAPLRESMRKQNQQQFDGIFGLAYLRYYSAVIDTRTCQLYLLDPLRREKHLQDNWHLAKVTGDAAPACRLRGAWFYQGNAHFYETESKETVFGMALEPVGTPGTMWLTDFPGKPVLRTCKYKIDGDTLTIAGPLLPGDDPAAAPASLDPPAAGKPKYSVLTFTRAKPPDKKP